MTLLTLLLGAAATAWTPGQFPGDGAIEARILALTNGARVRMGLPALKDDPRLRAAARQHSGEMRAMGYFSHTSPVSSHAGVGERAWIADFPWRAIGENIYSAEGHDPRDAEGAARLAVAGWLGSPGHRENLLGPGFTAVGIGVVSRGRTFWATQVLGDAVD